MAIENLQEVQEWLKASEGKEEVSKYIKGLNPMNLDGVKNFLESNEDGKKYLQSYTDSRVTKGIETFKANNLQKLVDEKIKELYPEEDPKDTEIKKMKAKIEKMEAETLRKELTTQVIKAMAEKKLPVELVDLLVGEDEQTTNKNLEALEKIFSIHVTKLVEEKLDNGYKPPKGGNNNNQLTKEQFAKMTYRERVKLASESPELYKKMIE